MSYDSEAETKPVPPKKRAVEKSMIEIDTVKLLIWRTTICAVQVVSLILIICLFSEVRDLRDKSSSKAYVDSKYQDCCSYANTTLTRVQDDVRMIRDDINAHLQTISGRQLQIEKKFDGLMMSLAKIRLLNEQERQ